MIRMLRNTSYIFFLVLIVLSCSDQSTQIDNGGNGNGGNGTDFNHRSSPGSSSEAFILDRDFDELIVEIQYMPGSEPHPNSINNLKQFLETHLDKATITILEPEEIPSGNQENYSATDVRNLEAEHRQHFTEDGVLASYAIFLDGKFSEGNVLGIAYYNTSTAYFAETIESISGGIGQPSRATIETTVFNHEFGHLMGLVNNGTEMVENHHDHENGAHCTEQECLMYFSVNTTDFFANIFGGSIPELDDFCLMDLQNLKDEFSKSKVPAIASQN